MEHDTRQVVLNAFLHTGVFSNVFFCGLFFWQLNPWCSGFCLSQDILALTGADAAEGLDPTPIGRGGMKRFRAGTSTEASRVRD